MNKDHLDIVVIDDDMEALAARAALEWWGVVVRTFFIGKSQDLVDIFSGKEKLSPNILIMSHGVDEGIVLPELGEEIAKQQPYDKFITGRDLTEFLKLNGQTIVNTGCQTGTKEFADAFLSTGAKSFIAPTGYPEGSASLLFVLNFYYHLFVKGLSAKDAHKKASSADSETEMFKLFE